MAFLLEPLSERSGAAAQRSVIIIATCKDIYDEPEHLLGNDGRLGSFPEPPGDGRCILYCDLLCLSLRDLES